MGISASVVQIASLQQSLPLFIAGYMALVVFAGIGNGSTYKMIPPIFRAKADLDVAAGASSDAADANARRLSGALIGIAGAVGALGGVLVNVAFRESFLRMGDGAAADVAFLGIYGRCIHVTWAGYRPPASRPQPGV